MPGKTNHHTIRTPEGIVFSQTIAGPLQRFCAWVIDAAVISVCMTILSYLVIILRLFSADIAFAATALGFFIIGIGYGILTEWYWRGQTVGKRVLRLRVVDVQGLRLQFNQIVIRNLLRFVDALPFFYFVGGVTCLINRKTQRLGDLAANTIVIYTPKISQPDLDQLLAGKFNSLRQYPHLEARLRQRVTPGEAGIVLQAILRREEFDPQARIELFHELAGHFRAKVEFPPEATDGIADEQYVRNIADILYRNRTGQKVEKIAA